MSIALVKSDNENYSITGLSEWQVFIICRALYTNKGGNGIAQNILNDIKKSLDCDRNDDLTILIKRL